jgi:hypothetical protein
MLDRIVTLFWRAIVVLAGVFLVLIGLAVGYRAVGGFSHPNPEWDIDLILSLGFLGGGIFLLRKGCSRVS